MASYRVIKNDGTWRYVWLGNAWDEEGLMMIYKEEDYNNTSGVRGRTYSPRKE